MLSVCNLSPEFVHRKYVLHFGVSHFPPGWGENIINYQPESWHKWVKGEDMVGHTQQLTLPLAVILACSPPFFGLVPYSFSIVTGFQVKSNELRKRTKS